MRLTMSKRLKIGIGVAIIVIAIGIVLYEVLFGFGGPRSSEAIAPTVEAASNAQVVYRIDPARSVVSYAVEEIFAGQPVSTAIGRTRNVAGDILLDTQDYSQSQVGTIVINVEQFESDSGLRDRRIRKEYLESSNFPEAVFVPSTLVGFPTDVVEGQPVTFEMSGDLTVKEITHSATWTVTATLDGDTLTGSASTTILMSTYDVGPINIAGFVETENEVLLTFDFVAVNTQTTPKP
jgi:polyisoprenoid-binding protein YceI